MTTMKSTTLVKWTVTFISNDRSERVATEQQIFGRLAMGRLEGGAADLVTQPETYDATRRMIEETRRAELEAKAAEEARLTDAGERGVPREHATSS